MVFELLIVAVICISGLLFSVALGLGGGGAAALGFLSGLFIFVTVGSIQIVTGLPTNPAWTLAATLCLPLLLWGHRLASHRAQFGHSIWVSALVLPVILAIVLFVYEFNLAKYHIDSFRYLVSAWLLAGSNYGDWATINLITARNFTVPLLHAPARLYDDGYVRSVTPLLSLSLLAALWWFHSTGTRQSGSRVLRCTIGAAMVLLIITNNRYIFNSFYVNGHLFFAACFTVIAASGWLLATRPAVPRPALLGIMAFAIPALIATRPEGPLAAALAVAPVLLSAALAWRERAVILIVFGVSTAAVSGYVVMAYVGAERAVPNSAIGLFGLGLAALVAVPILAWPGLTRYSRTLLIGGEALLWAGLGAFAVRNPDILVDSLAATYQNVVAGVGSWGSSLVMLTGIVFLVLLLCRDRSLVYLRFPVTAFVPLFLLLAYFRDSAYRVGNGDSLNRMLIQIVPLAILFVAAALTSDRWHLPERMRPWLPRRGDAADRANNLDTGRPAA